MQGLDASPEAERARRYLCDLDVGFLGELRHQEVLAVFLGVDLHVQVQPGDGRLRTQVPVQRLWGDRAERSLPTLGSTPTPSPPPPPANLQHVELRLLDAVHVAGSVCDVGEVKNLGRVNFLQRKKCLVR